MSFHELAIDPSAIRSWRDFQLVWGKAGFGKGRLIAAYPEKGPDKEHKEQGWAWQVIESINQHDKGSRKKVATVLETQHKLKLIKRGRTFNHGASWKNNAAREHHRLPFAALVESEAVCDGCRCTLDDFESEHAPECLRDDQQVMTLPKQPDEFAKGLFPMLRCAKAIRFVDPYFLKSSRSGSEISFSTKHAKVVQKIASSLGDINRVPQTVEFHMKLLDGEREEGDAEAQLSIFTKGMEAFLPRAWKAKAFMWRENLGGRRFHARYILTDVGGAGSEYGWDQGNSSADQTDLYLLPDKVLRDRTADFDSSSSAFTLATPVREFTGIRG